MNDQRLLAREPLSFHLGAKIVVVGAGPLAAIAIVGITSVLPQIAEALEPGPGTLMTKQLVGIVGLAMALGSPLAGYLLSRMSPRSFLTGAAMLYVVAGTAGLYVSDILVLVATRFFLGLSAAGIVIMAISLINTRLEGIPRARWMGIQVGLAMISSLAIHPISGALGEITWRLPFALFFLGIPFVVVAQTRLERERPPVGRPTEDKTLPRIWSWFPWQYAALALLIGSITFLPVVYGPFVMRQMGLTSPTLIGVVLTGDSLLGALVALYYGRSRQWFTGSQTFMISFAFTGVGALVAALAPSLPLLIVGMLILGIGMGWLIPNLITSLANDVSPQNQSKAAGLTKAFHYLASPACILVMEPVAVRYGPQSALAATALLSFVLFTFWGFRSWRAPAVLPSD
ncbi:MAG: hypothetical protein JWQ16_3066 [Novosphingobium sp.]|nr:hypothetical protein [Novosphingobium sp.]